MRTPALALLLVTACGQGDGQKYDLGTGGGGGGGGGAGGADANLGDSLSTPDVLQGKICLVTDPRDPTTCSTTSVIGNTVTLDGNTATTNADGTFQIDAPKSSTLQWLVTGNDIVPSVMSYSTSTTIPVVRIADYTDLRSENGVVATAGYGDVFIHVEKAGANVAQVVSAPTPTPLYQPLYDGSTASAWQLTGTGSAGVVWITQLLAGTSSTTLTPNGGTATSVGGIPVVDGAITWVNVELP